LPSDVRRHELRRPEWKNALARIGRPTGATRSGHGSKTEQHDGLERPDFSEWLYLLLIVSLPIMQPVYFHLRGYLLPPTDFIVIVTVAAAVFAALASKKRLPASRLLPYLALYAFALMVSAVASPDRIRSVIRLAGSFYLIGLAILGMFHVTSLAALRRAFVAWLVGTVITVVAALLGIVMFVAGVTDPRLNIFLSIHGSLPEGAYPRVMGLFLNPNMFCAYLVVSLAVLLSARRARWVGRRMTALIASAIVLAAFFSLSPGFGGLVLVIAFWTWIEWKETRPRLAKAAAISSVIVAIVFVLAITVSPTRGVSLQLRPSSRMMAWIASAKTFQAHPWFGAGVGLDPAHVEYFNPSGIFEVLTDAHNVWLSILAQAGFFGLVTFIALIAALLRGTLRFPMDTSRNILRSGLAVAFIAGFLYQSLSGSFENTRHVWVLVGLLAAAKELQASPS
jgi:O-antigen ligase